MKIYLCLPWNRTLGIFQWLITFCHLGERLRLTTSYKTKLGDKGQNLFRLFMWHFLTFAGFLGWQTVTGYGFVAFCIIDLATTLAKCLKWPFCVKVLEPSLSKDLRRLTFMKSLIYHVIKRWWSQTGSRHLTQSGVKLEGSLLVGDFDLMETRHL